MNKVVLMLSDKEKFYLYTTVKNEVDKNTELYNVCKNGFSDVSVQAACEHLNNKILSLTAVSDILGGVCERV